VTYLWISRIALLDIQKWYSGYPISDTLADIQIWNTGYPQIEYWISANICGYPEFNSGYPQMYFGYP
jgi:hypothetical protein